MSNINESLFQTANDSLIGMMTQIQDLSKEELMEGFSSIGASCLIQDAKSDQEVLGMIKVFEWFKTHGAFIRGMHHVQSQEAKALI